MTTYKVLMTSGSTVEAEINALAAKGYEVVSLSATPAGTVTVVLKLTA